MKDPGDAHDVSAIRALYDSWFGAMESGDVSAILSLVTPDVIVKMPASPPVVGRDALEQALRSFHMAHSETVEYEVEEVEVRSDLAFACISERATIRSDSGDAVAELDGMHLAILRRQPEGDWLVARDISSLNNAG